MGAGAGSVASSKDPVDFIQGGGSSVHRELGLAEHRDKGRRQDRQGSCVCVGEGAALLI